MTVQTKENILSLIQEYQSQIRNLGVRRLGVFGSFVREQQDVNSDIDILVEFEPGRKTFDNLNTVGGDVEAGLAIAEMVASMSKPTVSLVLGGGHSIGVPVAVAAWHSFITETASMTIHPIRLTGLVIGVPQTYEYLEKWR